MARIFEKYTKLNMRAYQDFKEKFSHRLDFVRPMM